MAPIGCYLLIFLGTTAATAPTLWPQPLSAQSGSSRGIVVPGRGFFTMSSGTLDAPPAILEAAFTRYNRIVFPHVSTPSPGLGITELSFDVESSMF